ncbi:hypothetical protein [Bradyrhizobium sp. AS23.2]|uniref:hypothetical protein n=1 Tax=Bradyrhizobium sp. AS23.2 TaxID=1680155 RepID=UPI00093A8C8D|nr:hypothetical protein [Bradyrhizobium sp. AS23.2]OKO86174.1 hypothetical protein AC630_03830 [Bradyrhizobium sp. AS23.2]
MTEDFKAAYESGKAAKEAAAANKATADAQRKQERDLGMATAEKWIRENVRPVFEEVQRQMEGTISVALPGSPSETPVGWNDKITLGNRPQQRKLSVNALAEGYVKIYIDDGEGLEFGNFHEPKAAEIRDLLKSMVKGIAETGG